MLTRKRTVGSSIEAWCGTCKGERAHTVAALNPDGTVHNVTCDHCKSSHRYRAPAAAAGKSAVTTPKRRRAVSTSGVGDAAPKVIRAYARHERYAVGEWIEHPTYGQGKITEVIAPTKVRIKFRDGERIFLQATPN
jgi:hypothetical protein